MLHRVARSPLFLIAVALVWGVAALLAFLFLAPPPRSVFEPTAPLAAAPATLLAVSRPTPTATARPAAPTPIVAAPAATPPGAPATPTPSAGALSFRVANTGGDGVFLRRTPSLADRLVAWPDGTRLQSLGEAASGDGVDWQKVRDPRGNVGYVPSRYLRRE